MLVFSRLGYLRQILRPPAAWRPAAVCGLPDGAAVLDTQEGAPAIHWHRTGSPDLQPGPLRLAEAAWSRIAAGSDGRLYVLDAATTASTVIGPDRKIESVTLDGPAVQAAIQPAGSPSTRPAVSSCRAWPGGWTGQGNRYASRPPPP